MTTDPQPNDDAPVLVEQCDRETAADCVAQLLGFNQSLMECAIRDGYQDQNSIVRAFAALRSRTVAASDVEPVAWMFSGPDGQTELHYTASGSPPFGWTETPLYAHPPAKPASDGEVQRVLQKVREQFPKSCFDESERVAAEAGARVAIAALRHHDAAEDQENG